MMQEPEEITPPAEEPVTLAQMKRELRIDHNEDDERIQEKIAAAREHVELLVGRSFLPRTYRMTLDVFPYSEVMLSRGPVKSIERVAYIDADGYEQTVAPDGYTFDGSGVPGWLVPVGQWPGTLAAINAVTVEYVAGKDTVDSVPKNIKQAIIVQAKELYEPDPKTPREASGELVAVMSAIWRRRVWTL